MAINKDYLAQKEKEIIQAAEEAINFDISDALGEEKQYTPKLAQAQQKVVEKLAILEDYYKLWEATKSVDFKTIKGKEAVEKQVYSFIFKTYQEIKKETNNFNILKDRILTIINQAE